MVDRYLPRAWPLRSAFDQQPPRRLRLRTIVSRRPGHHGDTDRPSRVQGDAPRGTEIGPMFLNSMPRLDVLSERRPGHLDAGWERLAAEVGVRFDHPRALELFRRGRPDGGRRGRALRPGLPARAGGARAVELPPARPQPGARPRGGRRPHDLRGHQRPAVRAGRRRAPRRHDGRPGAVPDDDPDDRRARHARPQHRRAQRRPAGRAAPGAGAGGDPAHRPGVVRRAVAADARPRTAWRWRRS